MLKSEASMVRYSAVIDYEMFVGASVETQQKAERLMKTLFTSESKVAIQATWNYWKSMAAKIVVLYRNDQAAHEQNLRLACIMQQACSAQMTYLNTVGN